MTFFRTLSADFRGAVPGAVLHTHGRRQGVSLRDPVHLSSWASTCAAVPALLAAPCSCAPQHEPCQLKLNCAYVPCRIDEGLVNSEKPWCGTRQFGMAFYDQRNQVCCGRRCSHC